ncbi:MAG TPA: hypothetical protein VJN65_02180 [Bacteroidota bacterium]|nr:hypothetical protein [Bacteroidota bacterium]
MFETVPEIAIICIASGVFLIARGWDALVRKTIKIRKTAGFPWKYGDVTLEHSPRLFRLTAWGILALGVFFLIFPFVVHYFV